jgi:hypothetical protein
MSLKEDIHKHIRDYYLWLNEKTQIKEINQDWMEITTPYLDRHNDCLQIYVKKEANDYVLSDDGYIINDLLNSGCTVEGAKRQELLKSTLAGLGVHLDGSCLNIRASSENFPLKKHSLVQAMLAVNDLFYLAAPHVSSLFFEDVSNWMDKANVRYITKIKFAGKSGYDHMFDFVIPKSKESPERIVQALNHADKAAVLLLVSKWLDTRETRPVESKLFAFLNDTGHKISPAVIDALGNYDMTPVLWSKRNEHKDYLVA